jgi:hypothetical protein
MPEEVTIREDLQVIEVKSYGDITLGEFKKTLESLIRLRDTQGLTKVLVDTAGVTSYPSTYPIFEFGEQLAESLRGVNIAIVVVAETRADSTFFRTVVLNRGGNVGVFDSAADALAWLAG